MAIERQFNEDDGASGAINPGGNLTGRGSDLPENFIDGKFIDPDTGGEIGSTGGRPTTPTTTTTNPVTLPGRPTGGTISISNPSTPVVFKLAGAAPVLTGQGPIEIQLNRSGQFTVRARRTKDNGNISFSAIVSPDSLADVQINSQPTVVKNTEDNSYTATYVVDTNTTTGPFRIIVKASTVGVDNEPLESNQVDIYGNVIYEEKDNPGAATIIPLRSVLNFANPTIQLKENGLHSIELYSVDTSKTNSLPDFLITDVKLDIIDPLKDSLGYSRVTSAKRGSGFSVNSQGFMAGSGAVTGVLTIKGKTNTVEEQIVSEEFTFEPIRNIRSYVTSIPANVTLENGTDSILSLFQINSNVVSIDSFTTSYDSDDFDIGSDYSLENGIVKVRVWKIKGTGSNSFIARLGVRFNDEQTIHYIETNNSIGTVQIIPPPVVDSSGEVFPQSVNSYVSINNSVIELNENTGKSTDSKLIGQITSQNVTGIDILPINVPDGLSVSVKNNQNGQPGIFFDVSVTNFSLAAGNKQVEINVNVSVQKNNNSAVLPLSFSLPIRVVANNQTHSPVPSTSYSIIINVLPNAARSVTGIASVQELDGSGLVVNEFPITNGELNRSWPDGTKLRIVPAQSAVVGDVQYNLVKVEGLTDSNNFTLKQYEPVEINGLTVYEYTLNATSRKRINIEYDTTQVAPGVEASFEPSLVNIRNGQTPAVVPVLYVTFTRTNKIQLSGEGFNGGDVLEYAVEYSKDPIRIERFISWDLFDKFIGSKTILLTASNIYGKVTQKQVTVSFQNVTEPPGNPNTGGNPPVPNNPPINTGFDTYNFVTDIRTNRPAIERGHTLTVEYDIKNVGRLLLDDGTGNSRLADIEIGFESESGESIIVSANVPTLKRRKIQITAPQGTYKVFAQVEGRTFPLTANDTSGEPHDTRLYSNTLLTVLPEATPAPPEPLTADDVINALIPVINDQLSISDKFTDLINDRKILRNLLVSEDSRREYLILNYIQDVDGSVILKLYDPLGQSEQPKGKYYIAYELVDPFVTTIDLTQNVTTTGLALRGPNFNIDDQTDVGMPQPNVNLIDTSKQGSTGLLRFDELLNYKEGSEIGTITDYDLDNTGYVLSGSITTDILNNVIGGRIITDEELGIDYSNYENFVFYSSAAERLTNFKYKLSLIESHESARNLINSGSVSSSLAIVDEINYYNTEINQIKATFDGYEKYLFNTTGSASWPKVNGRYEPTTASVSVNYYVSQSAVASLYDDENQYNLIKDIPEHIRRDTSNADFLLFVSMLGHHFDLIKCHVDAINRLFVRSHNSNVGTPTKLVTKLLESFGWQIRTRGAQADLIDYLLGKNKNGTALSTTTAKAREEELHRRFLNNLPYILKTKGTRASIRSLFNMYGIPTSLIKIQEFGGPKLLTNAKRYYTFDDPTQVLTMSGSNQVQIDLINSNLGRKPDSFEITFRTANRPAGHSATASGSYQLLTGKTSTSTYFTLNVDSVPNSLFNGKLRLIVSGSAGNSVVTSSKLPLFDNDLYTVGLIRTRTGTVDDINLYVKKAIYEKFTHEVSASLQVTASMWESASIMQIGNDFYGSVSEFRAWKRPLSEEVFDRHVLYNESISGGNYTSSLNELLIRLPFERPQNLATNTTLTNFAWTGSNGYAVSAATASNFTSVAADPYQFEYIEIDSAVEIPSIGFRADTDKIRFESQSLFDKPVLQLNTRITKKQFDDAPVDSNKLGIFISPTDEVNRDIVRSFGGLDFMNEIGNPADRYSSSYSGLNTINEHYWSRHSSAMNIYDYITLARQFDKTVFDYIDDVKPARTKVVKGLLIEPHILERNKVQHRKPTKEELFWDGTVSVSNTGSFNNEFPTFEANTINANVHFVMTGSFPTYMDSIDLTDNVTVSGESLYWTGSITDTISDTKISGTVPTWEATIRANVTHSISVDYNEESKLTVIGFEEDFKIPRSLSPIFPGGGYGEPQSAFGLYVKNGYADIIFVKEGVRKVKRFKVELIDLPESRSVSQLAMGQTQGQAGEYETVVVSGSYKALNILNVTASFTAGSERVNGYLPFHRIYTSDLTSGMMNSYYNGSTTTEASSIDGTAPVEIFISKPGVLKVNKKGDSETEPILIVE